MNVSTRNPQSLSKAWMIKFWSYSVETYPGFPGDIYRHTADRGYENQNEAGAQEKGHI